MGSGPGERRLVAIPNERREGCFMHAHGPSATMQRRPLGVYSALREFANLLKNINHQPAN
jgi:hypothetical protein